MLNIIAHYAHYVTVQLQVSRPKRKSTIRLQNLGRTFHEKCKEIMSLLVEYTWMYTALRFMKITLSDSNQIFILKTILHKHVLLDVRDDGSLVGKGADIFGASKKVAPLPVNNERSVIRNTKGTFPWLWGPKLTPVCLSHGHVSRMLHTATWKQGFVDSLDLDRRWSQMIRNHKLNECNYPCSIGRQPYKF